LRNKDQQAALFFLNLLQ